MPISYKMMTSKQTLIKYQKEYWGKIWTLLYLKQFYSKEFWKYLIDDVVIKNHHNITQEELAQILALLPNENEDLLARTSSYKDRDGCINWMPSSLIDMRRVWWDTIWEDLKEELEKRIGKLPNYRPNIYDSLSLSLYHSHKEWTPCTITQHPNNKSELFIDIGEMGSDDERLLLHYLWDGKYIDQTLHKDMTIFDCNEIAQLTNQITGLPEFHDTKDVHQFEYLVNITTQEIKLTQIRKLCETFSDYYHIHPDQIGKIRVLGNMPEQKKPYPIINYNNLFKKYKLQNKVLSYINRQKQDFILNLGYSIGDTQLTTLIENKHLIGCISPLSLAFFHNISAPAQIALQNGGFVICGVNGLWSKIGGKRTFKVE